MFIIWIESHKTWMKYFIKFLLTLTIRSKFDRIVNINVIDLDKSFRNDYQNTAIINRMIVKE